jgi:hypothetical protein
VALHVILKYIVISASSLINFVSLDNYTYLLMIEITKKTLKRVLNSLSNLELL